jgi:glycosyltransferase involved in cell wall biosynthesis
MPENAAVPLISVVVPFRNARAYLHQCIHSLLDQTLSSHEYEVILVDNNSSDGGRAIVAKYPQVTLLQESADGAYAARNRGLEEATGDIVAFTDSDCEVDRDWLERIAEAVRAPGVLVVLGQRVAATDRGLLNLVSAYESQKATYVMTQGRGPLIFGYTNNMAMRRQVLEEQGPFPEMLRGGDTVMVSRIVEAYGSSVARYCPAVRVRHLEMTSLWSYYSKNRTYGGSNERAGSFAPYRPLRNHERWRIFRNTVQERELSFVKGGILLAALIPGMLCFEWSRYMARRGLRNDHLSRLQR